MTLKQKQCLLYVLGYYVGNIDGVWGSGSKAACAAFQKDFGGLNTNGIADDATVKAMKHSVAYGIAKNEDPVKTGDFWDEIKYFKKSEFSCKCGCGANEMNETLIRVADRTREYFGSPMRVSSGRRCASHNAKVGGVSNSRHATNPGKAMDFCVSGKTSTQILEYVQKQPEIRYAYAIDSSYVHMDIN